MNSSKIHLLTYIQGLTLLVYKDAHGHQLDALLPNGTVSCYRAIFYLPVRSFERPSSQISSPKSSLTEQFSD